MFDFEKTKGLKKIFGDFTKSKLSWNFSYRLKKDKPIKTWYQMLKYFA